MTAHLDVRPLKKRERHAVRDLLRTALRDEQHYAAMVRPPEHEGFYAREWQVHEEGLKYMRDGWMVARLAGEIVGCLWLVPGIDPLGPYLSIRQVAVDRAYRNRGIGTASLHTAIDTARAAGVHMLLISGFESNPAILLYRRLGFIDLPLEFREDANPNHVVLWMPLVEAEKLGR